MNISKINKEKREVFCINNIIAYNELKVSLWTL